MNEKRPEWADVLRWVFENYKYMNKMKNKICVSHGNDTRRILKQQRREDFERDRTQSNETSS